MHQLSGDWSLRYGEFEVSQDGTEVLTEVEDLPETSCSEWGVMFVEMTLQGPDQSAETREIVRPCDDGGHEYQFDDLTAGDYLLHAEALVADGSVYFFNEEEVTVEPWGGDHDAMLVPLIGMGTLSYTADDSSGECEAEEVDSVVITFTPVLPGQDAAYPTEGDLSSHWSPLPATNFGTLLESVGAGSSCLQEMFNQLFPAMSQRGWKDPALRARAVQGYDWEGTIVGMSGELETHTAESQERRIPVGATPPVDFGLICLDTTGSCD
jgi:hypothetical protein